VVVDSQNMYGSARRTLGVGGSRVAPYVGGGCCESTRLGRASAPEV